MKRVDGNMLYGSEELEQVLRCGVDPSLVFIAPNTIHVENAEDTSANEKRGVC